MPPAAQGSPGNLAGLMVDDADQQAHTHDWQGTHVQHDILQHVTTAVLQQARLRLSITKHVSVMAYHS
jgi:hypothetical protein